MATDGSAHAPPPFWRRTRRRDYGLLLAGLFLLIVGLDLAVGWRLALPVCVWRRLTGIPCPLCGSTRCLVALAHGELVAALRWNPLTAFAGVAITAAGGLGLIRPTWPVRGWAAVHEHLGARRWVIALVALAVNWLYLLFNLPR